ncbi:SEC-C domain-containing protein [bacterium]|nr:SEC-C domain-containing protein [bacterium]
MALKLKGNKEPDRNEPCPCKSGLKFKYCHGDKLKQAVCNRVANEKMVQLIREEQRRKGISIKVVCPDCNQMTGMVEHCEFCNHTGVVDEKLVKERYEEDYKRLTETEI